MGTRHWPEDAIDAVERLEAEINSLRDANRIACEDLVEQQNLRVKYAEQIDLLRKALEFCAGTSYITDAHEAAEEALAAIEGDK